MDTTEHEDPRLLYPDISDEDSELVLRWQLAISKVGYLPCMVPYIHHMVSYLVWKYTDDDNHTITRQGC